MLIFGLILLAIGSYLFLCGIHTILKVSILRVTIDSSQAIGWRKPVKWLPRRKWSMGPVAWSALESNDEVRIEKEATALTTESIIFYASSAF